MRLGGQQILGRKRFALLLRTYKPTRGLLPSLFSAIILNGPDQTSGSVHR